MYRRAFFSLLFVASFLALPSLVLGQVVWDAGGNGVSAYQEENWHDTLTDADPLPDTINSDVPIEFNLEVSGEATVGGASGIGGRFVLADGISVTVNDTAQWRQFDSVGSNFSSGLNGTADGAVERLIVNDQAIAYLQFAFTMEIVLNDSSVVVFRGGNDPLSDSTVRLESDSTRVYFLNETVESFRNEHLPRFSVFGGEAIQMESVIFYQEVIVTSGETVTVVEPITEPIILGDVNLDGSVNLLDASAFISAITGGDYVPEADINLDGVNDLQDVAGFVNLLIS